MLKRGFRVIFNNFEIKCKRYFIEAKIMPELGNVVIYGAKYISDYIMAGIYFA